MICARCQTDNEPGRKFCMECGTPLAAACPSCGAANNPAAKFCGECGTTLSAAAAPAAPAPTAVAGPPRVGTAERRLVTVLFADLVGFTTLAQDLDPEDTREFLTRYFDLTRTIIERYGGTVEKFIGDAVMAVWGAPTAHEDDAERAVRAALEIVSGVPGIAEQPGVEVRAGVLTGEAAVTVGAAGQGMVAGDLVNTASRLQSVAPPGSVLVGESTFRAASGAISFEAAGEQMLKGKEAPVQAWRATAVVGLRGGSGRAALEPPFTGRNDELRLLKDLFHATEREQKSRLVSVVGEGGIGKSRLVWELEKYIDGFVGDIYWHIGRSPSYGSGISYWALAEMVRGRSGIAETDEPAVARQRLQETLAEWLPDDQERRWVEPRLAGLLALEPMPPGSRDELFAAWRTFFERIAGRGPAVLVFEDVQWADEGMLDFIEDLLDKSRNLPIFVVTLSRPEIHERRPGWGSAVRSLTTMKLEPLEAAQMEDMVRGALPGLSQDVVRAIVDRAGGIPLYAVETMRMLIDRGDLVAKGDGAYEMRGSAANLAVPDTLHALIAARLDALGERDRRLIQTAAVVGQSFTLDALAAVAGEVAETSGDALAGLVRRQMLQVDLDPRSPERGQYQFVQAVVREVAEASLSRADRRTLHVAAARYYESLGDDELAGVLANHYVEAYRAAPPGPEADALVAQARISLRAAAERAMALHSNQQALGYLEQALQVTQDPVEQSAIHERAVEAAINASSLETALEHGRAAEALSRERGDRLAALHAVALQARVNLSYHHELAAIAQLQPALEDVADLEVTREVVEAQAQLARGLMMGGSPAESIQWSDRALAHSTLADDQLTTDLLITKGTALANLGRMVEGEILLRGAMQVAEHSGDMWAALRARNNALGVVSSENLADGAAMLADGYEIARRHGLMTWAYQFAHAALSQAFELGEWEAWLEETAALDAPDFYRAWRVLEDGVRDVLRGRVEEGRRKLEEGKQLAGRDSTQGITAIAAVDAVFAFAAQDWAAVMPAARRAWVLLDSSEQAIVTAAAAAAAANEPEWAREALTVFDGFPHRGRHTSGMRQYLLAVVAMLEGRWPDARAAYLAARRDLAHANAHYLQALLNLAVAGRGRGHMPEATEAAAAAREFFDRVGAGQLVDAYLSAVVAGPTSAATGKPADARSGVGAS